MVKLSRILKDYAESGALSSLIGVHEAVDNQVFLTKAGALLGFLRVKGVDAECQDAAQTDQIARRFEAALRGLDETFRIYQYFLKRRRSLTPVRKHDNPVVQQAVSDRRIYLESKDLYEIDLLWAVVYEGWRPPASGSFARGAITQAAASALRSSFSLEATSNQLNDSLARASEILVNKLNRLAIELHDVVAVEVLDKRQAFESLRRLLNYSPEKAAAVGLSYDESVDFQACSSELECHLDHLRLDDCFVQVLTVKEPPSRTWANLLGRLSEIESELILVSEWKRESNGAARKRIGAMRRHFHNSKSSMLNYLNSAPPANDEVLIDHGAAALVRDLGDCLEEMDVHGRHFGQWSLTLLLYDADRARLTRSVSEAFKTAAALDLSLTEERYNLLNAFLAALPGNDAFNLRRLWLSSANYADLSILFAPDSGEPVSQALQDEHLAVFETRQGTPYFFNLHYQDIGHTLILGASGSGKSFLTNFLLTHLQKYEPLTFVFDLGGSYETLTRLFAGAYSTMRLEQSPAKINPFSLPPTAENRRFLLTFVKVLAESGGYRTTSEDERDLHEQIENLYAIESSQRRLLTLANIVNRNLREALQVWIGDGAYARLFDNIEDTLTIARFQAFDFEGMDKAPRLLEPLLFYVLHRANAVIVDPALETTFKVFVIDEAWRFLRHPAIRSYIEESFKTWRKKNAAMILVTQSGDDLLRSEILPVAVESCPTKLFLANPGADVALYREAFRLNETEAALLPSLIPKQQLLVKRPNRSKTIRLTVDDKGYWLYTNSPLDNHKKREAFARYGFEKGLEHLARSQP